MVIETVRQATFEQNEKEVFEECVEILDDIITNMEVEGVRVLDFENAPSVTVSKMEEIADILELLLEQGLEKFIRVEKNHSILDDRRLNFIDV